MLKIAKAFFLILFILFETEKDLRCWRKILLFSASKCDYKLTFANNSALYQITRQVGSTSLAGFRDFCTWKFLGIRYAPKSVRFEPSIVYDEDVQHLPSHSLPSVPNHPMTF
jgi:hypothetical protein